MKKIFYPVTIITSLCVIPLTFLTLYYNIPPAISGAGNILLLMSSYVFDRRSTNIIVAGIVNMLAMLIVLIAGYMMHEDFLLARWIAEIIAYSCVASLLYFLSQHVRDLKELKKSEQRLETAMEAITAGLWDWNIAEGDQRWWSPLHFELLGYEVDEIKPSAETLRAIIHPDDVEMAYQTMEAHLKKKGRFEIELRYKTKSGLYKWFLASGVTVFNERGEAIRMIGSIIDIDEKKRAQETIVQQAALIQMMPDGVIYADKNRNVISINKGAEKLLEVKANDIVGKKLDDFVTVHSLGMPNDVVRKELWSKGFWRGEVETVNHKGNKNTVLATVKILNNINSNESGWVCIYTDISMLRLNEELKQALKEVKINNQYLEQLAYISAHDIKSPITTLDGLVDIMINAGIAKGEYANTLNMIKSTTQQMYRTNTSLNNILRLRQTLLAGQNTEHEHAPLKTIITDIQTTLKNNIESIKGNLTVELNGHGDVAVPHLHFKSILYNLLGNAIKYHSPERTLQVTLTVIRKDNKGLIFTIADNGLGIDLKRNKEKLFGIFRRFHDHVEGTGVGLHMVKSIVDAYGGSIEIESEPGIGTRFTVSFNDIM